jgi:DNA-binding transcriptional LysR family regulator
LVARKAGNLEGALYASPAYLNAAGVPANPADLEAHRCVLFRPTEGQATWTLLGPEGAVSRRVQGRIGGDDFSFVRGAAVAGAGVALLPQLIAADDLAAGRLVRVLPQYVERGGALYVVYAAARVLPAKISAFRDFVLQFIVQSCPSRAPSPAIAPEPARGSKASAPSAPPIRAGKPRTKRPTGTPR